MPSQKGSDQPTLRTILLRRDVANPTVSTFERARERVFVTT
jgi:hypothetical protein